MNIKTINFLNAILSGIVAGLIVYIVTETTESRRWSKVQKKLVQDFNVILNALISSVRIELSVKISSATMNKQDFFDLISQQIIVCFQEKHASTIQSWTSKEWNVIISNFRQSQEALVKLAIIFTNFRASDPWYLEAVLLLEEKIRGSLIPILTFPEMGGSNSLNCCAPLEICTTL